jgi:hypothetical protein
MTHTLAVERGHKSISVVSNMEEKRGCTNWGQNCDVVNKRYDSG